MSSIKPLLDEAGVALGELRYALLLTIPPNRHRAWKAIFRLSKAIYEIMRHL